MLRVSRQRQHFAFGATIGNRSSAANFLSRSAVSSFSLKELEAHTRAILRRSTVSTLNYGREDTDEPHCYLQCHGVEMFLDSAEAYVDGELIDLSRTEFDVLRYFMEHAGVAVTAEQLVAAVWGYTGYDRHIVETNVYRLRRKIEQNANDPQRLITVRGFGYKFTEGTNGEAQATDSDS